MSGKVLEILLPILFAISTGVAGIIGLYFSLASLKIKKQIANMKDEEDRALAEKVINEAEEAIKSAVIHTNQTLVESLKNSSQDGKLTTDEIASSFQQTYNTALELIGQQGYYALKNLKPDVENWIKTKIEIYVNQVK